MGRILVPSFTFGEGPDRTLFWDDFHELNLDTTTGLAKWLFFETGGSGSAKVLEFSELDGVLELTQSGTSGDVMTLISNWSIRIDQLKSGQPITFGARFKTPATISSFDFNIGLVGAQDTSISDGVVDYVGFTNAGSAAMDLRARKDSVSTTVGSVVTLAASTWVRAFFRYTPTSTRSIGTLEYAVHTNNTSRTGSVNTNGNFPDDVPLQVVIAWKGINAAEIVLVDWIYVDGYRAAYTEGVG